jgi:hypothetical protein
MVRVGAFAAGSCLFLLVVIAGAQESAPVHFTPSAADTLLPDNSLAMLFDNSYNTYHWRALGFLQSESGGVALSLNEQFTSSIIRTNRTFITDQQLFDIVLRRRISQNLKATVRGSSFLVSDDQSINLTKLSTETLYGGVTYRMLPSLSVEPLIGGVYDKQISQADKGISYLFTTNVDTLDYNGYKTTFAGRWRYDQMSPRRQESRNAFLSLDKTFFEDTRNFLTGYYSEARRDVYVPADPAVAREYDVTYNIESRTEENLGVTDTLRYGLGRGAVFTINGTAAGRQISRSMRLTYTPDPTRSTLPATVDELRLESVAQINYAFTDSTRALLRLDYAERDEHHSLQNPGVPSAVFPSLAQEEARKNNQSRRTSLAGSINSIFSPDAGMSLAASATILRYDTPSEENDDDRDELRYFMSLAAHCRLNRYLFVRLNGDMNLMHLVYLASTRSASNTWNRIIRLAPTVVYTPSDRFATTNQFEVLANYSVYDYEFSSSPIQSFAYRQFSFRDSSTIVVTGKISATWYHYLKFYEQGEFRWDDFSELPVTYYEDKLYIATIRFMMQEGLLFSAGFRYFSQLRYSYQGAERFADRFLRSFGPLTGIQWTPGSHATFSLNGWYERQHQNGEPDRTYTTMSMNIIIHI